MGQCFFVSSSWLSPCVAELLCLLGLVEWPHVAGVLEGVSKSGTACQGMHVFTLIDSSKIEVLISTLISNELKEVFFFFHLLTDIE